MTGRFDSWMAALEARHLADLTFSEVARALRALSSTYVERRRKIAEGAALSGAGKRAAFALFYTPLHYLLISHIVDALSHAGRSAAVVADLGCGTGAAGVAWAHASKIQKVFGIDRNPWAAAEAAWTYRAFGLRGRVRQGDVVNVRLPDERAAIVVAFTVNELPDASRDVMLARLLDRAARGDEVLVVEPLARFVAPWWNGWREAFLAAGGRADEWRVRTSLPAIVEKLDRAAGLDHRELTGRSLYVG